mmetsp:Transcript_13198/g.39721  ORF Transcript_13198/g.39721 Transcript_13198/m.39721 type:complete len:612 (-) Transcript_13198:116-1951(-)
MGSPLDAEGGGDVRRGHRRTRSGMSIISNSTDIETPPEIRVFADEPRKGLLCRLCSKVYSDPVIVSCGHTYCKRCVLTAPHGATCPSRSHDRPFLLAHGNAIPNLEAAEEIADLQVHCQFGCKEVDGGGYVVDAEGCSEVVRLSERQKHEANCPFRTVRCPYNPSVCPKMRVSDLEVHLKTCSNVPCRHRARGCKFLGTQDGLAEHLKDCKYELVKGLLAESDAKIQHLSDAVESRDQDIEFLKAVVGRLSERVDDLESLIKTHIDALGGDVEHLADEISGTNRHISEIQGTVDGLQVKVGAAAEDAIADLSSHTFKCVGTFVGHQGPVWALAVHGDLLFSGSSDETIKVWDTRTSAAFRVKRTLQGHRGIVHALATYDHVLYSGSHDCTINVWSIGDDFELQETLTGHDNPVCCLAVANGTLFSGSLKIVNIWDLDTLQLIGSVGGFNHWVRALVATPQFLYAGSYQVVSVWSSDPNKISLTVDEEVEGECLESLRTQGGSIYSLTTTDDYVIAGTYEHLIHIWDVSTYDEVQTLSGHAGTVYALAVMQQKAGKDILFSASYDRTVRVWSLDTFTCIQTLLRHENSVDALAVSRGWVFSGAADSQIKVWQ